MSETSSLFSGVQTALATPMRDGSVDWNGLEQLVERQIDEGIDGLVAVGTTGESPTLSDEEHIGVIRRTAEIAAGRVPVIAGTGSNSTTEALELSREAIAAGADALLQVAPYYNKPNQEGLFLHFSAIASAVDKPIILYSIPSRCGIEIGVDTTARLYEKHPHICGMKEAGGSCDRVSQLKHALGPDFSIMSGDDSLTLPFLSVGACGVISVASNLFVKDLRRMVEAALQGRLGEATAIHLQYAPLFEVLFLEPNPVPVKYAMKELGIIPDDQVRLPLAPLTESTRRRVQEVLASLNPSAAE